MRHPLSLAAFTDWLATMPADGKYIFCSIDECAMGQYRRSIFGERGSKTFAQAPVLAKMLGSGEAARDAYFETCAVEPHTFGAALSRARELQRTAGHD